MAAGQGYIEFATGDVLTAAAANGYLASQVVMVFASSSARTSAIASPQEGMLSYLKDTNAVEAYDGSAWISIGSTGDITGVTAGTGISGGGTSGTVTVTNSMATAITTAGDLIKGTGSGTFDRLGIGSTGQVLTVSGGAPVWATPSSGGGGKVLQVVSATYSTQYTTTSSTMQDTGLSCSITPSASTSKVLVLMTNNFGVQRTGDDDYFRFQVLRGATTIFIGNSNEGFAEANQASNLRQFYVTDSISYLDSPATTSATTYKVQIRSVGGGSAIAQYAGDAASIILLEIGA